MSSFLSGIVKSSLSLIGKEGASFPYSVGDRVEWYDGQSIWALHHGTKKEDGSPVSIFAFDCQKQKDRLPLARNAFKKLRTLRHPDLLRYLDGLETENLIYIVTDHVEPLQNQLKQDPDDNLIIWGLYKIANAIKFINNDCQMVHGNIRTSSIFLNKAGEWKLGGMELLSSMKEDGPIILTYGGLVPDSSKYASPETRNKGWNVIKDFNLWATDSWLYGCLIYEVYNGYFSSSEQLQTRKNIPQNIFSTYKQLLNPTPNSRLDMNHVIEQGLRSNGFFQADFVKTNLFLENLSMKEQKEKEDFYKTLDTVIEKFPQDFCKFKILPELTNAFEYGAGGAKVLGPIIKIGAHLTDEEYERLITNCIVKMFASPDRTIRVSLLENLPNFVNHLSNKVVNDKIFPNVATGFSDGSPVIREQTVKSTLLLVSKLSERTINYELLKHLAKCQMDEEPGIRTNTTICLGKLSKYLTDSMRKKVLVAAFTRSLRDPFIHARIAGLMALNATMDYYDAPDCSTKIIPCVSLTLIDPEKLVRTQAFKTLDLFIKRMEKLVESMPDTTIPIPGNYPPNGVTPSGGNTATNLAVNAASMVGGQAANLAGWAFTSLATRLTSGGETPTGEITPTNTVVNKSTITAVNNAAKENISKLSQQESTTSRMSMVDHEEIDEADGWINDDLIDLKQNDEWETFDVPDPSPRISPTPDSKSFSNNTPAVGKTLKFGSTSVTTGMKLGGHKSATDTWGTEEELSRSSSPNPARPPSLRKSEDEDDWGASADRPSTPDMRVSVLSKEERKAELERKREERRQRMAELKEKKKTAGGIGARKV